MATVPDCNPACVHEGDTRRSSSAPVLVATRGEPVSDGAVELALAMSAVTGCSVRILAVVPPVPGGAPELGAMVQIPIDELEGRAGLQRSVEAQLRRLGVGLRRVAIDVRSGEPPAVIVRAAREVGAKLILLGAADHDLLERMFGAHTAARVARSADVPVMVVPRGCAQLPESALVAVDFSDTSVRAGRVALTLFPDLDVVHLVHVAPSRQPALEAIASTEGRHLESAERAFNEVRDALPLSACTVVGREVARGNAARELLRLARERRVDLIVAGSHGHGALQRMLVGSVATALLRGARVPVLVLPARAGAGIRDPRSESLCDPTRWARALDEFSERNAGRRATLEVDDPEIGAQAQEVDYPFRGCVYDPLDGRVAVMLGDGYAGARHLTRGVVGVSEVDVLRGEDGRDRALRIAHGRRGGQTILEFTS